MKLWLVPIESVVVAAESSRKAQYLAISNDVEQSAEEPIELKSLDDLKSQDIWPRYVPHGSLDFLTCEQIIKANSND